LLFLVCSVRARATRFATYGVDLDPVSAAYRDTVLALPARREWLAEAETEPELPNH
jgi:glutathione S-transferase